MVRLVGGHANPETCINWHGNGWVVVGNIHIDFDDGKELHCMGSNINNTIGDIAHQCWVP